MMKMAFTPAPTVVLPIADSDAGVPVRRIYCVGKNYHAHAKEMGGEVSKDAPFFFIKHPLDITLSGASIAYPAGTQALHFELELVAVVGQTLRNASLEQARQAVFGYAVGIDLTRRDLQLKFKQQSLPWALSKSFTHAAIVSPVITDIAMDSLGACRIVLKQNGEIRQDANLSEMARGVDELLVYLSQLDTLSAGDIVFTGTPAGVGAVRRGDTLHGSITGIGEVNVSIAT